MEASGQGQVSKLYIVIANTVKAYILKLNVITGTGFVFRGRVRGCIATPWDNLERRVEMQAYK